MCGKLKTELRPYLLHRLRVAWIIVFSGQVVFNPIYIVESKRVPPLPGTRGRSSGSAVRTPCGWQKKLQLELDLLRR